MRWRPIVVWILRRCADVTLFVLWLWCVETVFHLWGLWPVVIGLVLFVVGIIPVAAVLFLFHGQWSHLALVVIETGMVFTFRMAANWFFAPTD